MKSYERTVKFVVCRFFLVLALLLSIVAAGAYAQSTGGRIRGTITDPQGGAVVGAKVTLINSGTNTSRTADADSNGAYLFLEVPVGTYEVDATQTGFKKSVQKGIVLNLNEVVSVDLSLQLGGGTETVEVTGAPPVIDTTTTQLGAVMTDKSVRELPLNTRNTYQLLQLQPGVQSQLGADLFYGSDNPGVVSVNGGRGRSNNYMVNGGDGNDIFVNGPAIQPSPDAIDEFRVLTNTFDAEYGRNSGSVVNVVTKSGTNAVHGDFYEFFRNKVLNTKNFFDSAVPDYKQNQFGGTLGGPIKKDKTFIFGSYEGDRIRKGISSGSVLLPTAAEAGGDFSGVDAGGASGVFTGTIQDQTVADTLNARTGCANAVTAAGGAPIAAGTAYSAIFPNNKIPTACFDPTSLALYQNYVAPFGTGAVNFAPVNKSRTDQFTVRFDHSINTSQRLSVYYYFEDDNSTLPFSFFQAAGANVPGFGGLFKTRVQQWNVNHTWTIGSNAVNEFRFNYFREGQGNLNHPVNTLASLHDACGSAVPAANCFADPANPSLGITTVIPGREGVPFVNVAGGFSLGNNFEGELPQIGNTFQWSDNYSKVIGSHSVKFGGDVRRQRFDQFLYFNINGDFTYQGGGSNDVGFVDPTNSSTVNFYPNYFLGLPFTFSQGAAQGLSNRNTSLYLFAQDSWKIKPNITVNYGLRWELNTPYIDTKNRLQTFRPGQATTQYPCWLSASSAAALGAAQGDCGQNTTNGNNAYFPLGLVFPGDKGVPQALTSTYYKAFAPRFGLAWSPGAHDGWLAKLTGGPGKSTVRGGFGVFYNPIEQLVMEQFSAEPPFGVSVFLSNPMMNTPYLGQNGAVSPNNAIGIINQTPNTPCFDPAGPKGCVDWSLFRPALLFGEFQPHLRSQYSEQYNFTIERQLGKDMLLRVAYVGTQGHRLLASRDLNYGNANTCLDLQNLPLKNLNQTCGPVGADNNYTFTLPAGVSFHMPYIPGGPNGTNIPCPQVGAPAACLFTPTVDTPINLVGIRPYSSPNCNPLTSVGCPADGVSLFSNIFTEDTIGNSNYNALQVSLEKNYSHGLLFQMSYTWSKAIDQGATFENELNPIDPRATRGVSLLSAKHRFVFSPVWEIPFKKREGFAGKATNGWQVSAIITYQSGFPIRIQDGNDAELQSSFFFEDANTPQVTGKVQFLDPKKNGGQYFSTGNITDPAPGTFGNLPHALCCGPAINNTDLVISKKTRFSERWDTEFRAEFYNAWNHTQFNNPDGNFSDSTFGVIQKAKDPRLVQFGLKIFF
ncbi:MAG TPA: carboxypeptidase regulatory-like domain-containing protein [Candidatus Acidoferrum sp.]|nr:carboxypeptidase regulatory-like domain-containing protein [Candidatus Acidoferrum sp.]